MLTYLKAHLEEAFDPDEVLILVGAFDKAWRAVLASGAKFEASD